MRHEKTKLFFLMIILSCLMSMVIIGACGVQTADQRLTAEAQSTQKILLTQGALFPTDVPVSADERDATETVLKTQRAEITQRTAATLTEDAGKLTRTVDSTNATQTAIAIQTQQAQQAEELRNALIWKADFEDGTISQVKARGDFLNQGSGQYNLVTFGHTGNYSVGLTIDTSQPSETGSHAAYLFYWDEIPDEGYYSAWFYLPAGVQVQQWWTIMQWKSTYDGNPDNSVRVFSLGVQSGANGELHLSLNQRPTPDESDGNNVLFDQNVATIPLDKWFHVEVFYKRSNEGSGQVILWQDGVELLNLDGVNTAFSDNTVYWSIHNYTDNILPHPYTIYVDDLALSLKPIGNLPLP